MRFDMTRGKPVSLLARFALPLIVSSMLQQLYTLCDSAIVGRLLGENAFAAVGAAAFLHGIPLSILLGCTQGFGVAVGQRFGAKDDGGVNRFFPTALLLSLSFGLALSRAGAVSLRHLLLPGRAQIRELLRLGVPPMLSFGVNAASGGLYQRVINGFGVAVITGMSASYRYFDLLNVVGYGMEGAVATFTAQNAGAKDYRRIRRGTNAALLLGGGATVSINLLAVIFAEPMIGLFLGDGLTEAVQAGAASLRVRSAFVVSMYLLCAWRAAISGMGNAVIPMISGFLELGLKTAAILTLPRLLGLQGLYLMDAAAWIPVALFLGLCYRRILKQKLYLAVRRTVNGSTIS